MVSPTGIEPVAYGLGILRSLMKTIEKDMTSLQIQRAKSLAREWEKDQKKK